MASRNTRRRRRKQSRTLQDQTPTAWSSLEQLEQRLLLAAVDVTIDAVAPGNDNTPDITGTIDNDAAAITVVVDGVFYTESSGVTHDTDANTWTLLGAALGGPLPDGTNTISVLAQDGADFDTDSTDVDVDTTAPVVTVDPLTTNDNRPEVTGTIDDPTATIEVVIDGSTYTTGGGGVTNNGDGTWTLADDAIAALDALGDGTYEVAVTGTDAVGNAGTDATNNELTVDTTAPTVGVDALTTNDTTPDITGTIDDAAASISVVVDGNTYTTGGGDVTNNGDGTWTLLGANLLAPLAEGTYDVAVTGTDALGNADVDATADELVIDTTAPVAGVDALTTNDTTPDITGTVDDAAAALSVVVDGNTYTTGGGTVTNNGDGTWTLAGADLVGALADGTYDVEVTATDAAGNDGTDATTDELVVDTAAPAVTIDALTTNDTTPELTGTVDKVTATILVTIDGNDYTATNNLDGTWTLADNTIAPALAEAGHAVQVVATNGVAFTIANGTVTVDTTAPTVTADNLGTVVDDTPDITGTIDDATAALSVVVDGVTYTTGGGEVTNNGDGTWTLLGANLAAPLADATYDVDVTATDAAGNTDNDPGVGVLEVDATAPTVTVDALTTNDTTPDITGTIDDPAASISVVVGGNTYTTGGGDVTNNGDGTWTLLGANLVAPLAEGTYDVAVTGTDVNTNDGVDATTDELVIDTTAPVVTVDNVGLTNDATPTVTGTIDDDAAVLTVTIDGVDYTLGAGLTRDTDNNTWSVTVTPAALADGTYDVAASAEDTAGNVGTDATTDELEVDATAPVVTVDALNTFDNTPELTGTVDDATATIQVTVNGVAYAATNNGDGTWMLADGTVAALPSTDFDVAVTATDAAGNVGADATADELSVRTLVTLGQAGNPVSVVFTDPDGTIVTVRSGVVGEVDVVLTSTSVVTEDGTTRVLLTSDDGCEIENIDVVQDTPFLTFYTRGGTTAGADIGGITGDAMVTRLSGRTMDLVGAIDMTLGVIGNMSLRNIMADVFMGGVAPRDVSINVNMAIDGAEIVLDGSSIRTLNAGAILDSSVFVGVGVAPDGTLPVVGDLLANFSINRVNIRGYRGLVGPAFDNSFIAADTIGTVNFRDAQLDNGGEAFGFVTNDLGRMRLRQDGGLFIFNTRWLDAPDDLTVRLV